MILIVGMMIVPLSSWLMDLLIAANLAISMLIFALALFQKNPLQFMSFPSVLLIATLFRLALNVSSTRLILTRADAGRIIGGFGGFIVGGDIIVGAVIFGVILMVLFLVITKGAERVAEVAARFTLDALPGMQLAIDTDLRSKTISPRELTLRREALEKRSMYYGSLDGAMKFVRGDAVAALVITVINIAGGISVGLFRQNMNFIDSLNLYGRLTVGDGLVTMIPALLISTAAGLLVTRVAQGTDEDGLAEQLRRELSSTPNALLATATMMILLAVVPGLPAWPFLIAAAGLGAAVLIPRMGSARQRSTNKMARASVVGDAISLDELQQLLDNVSQTHPVLVREAVWQRISLSKLSDLLGELQQDGIDSRYLPDILDALARITPVDDMDELMLHLRQRLSSVISASIGGGNHSLAVITLEMETEQLLQTSLVTSSRGKRLVLPPELGTELVENIDDIHARGQSSIILVSDQLRRPLQRFLRASLRDVRVVGHGELTDETCVEVCAQLSL